LKTEANSLPVKLDRYQTSLPLVKERTRWVWNVTPMKSGDLILTVTLTAPVTLDGRETGYKITSFDRAVTVTVTTEQRVGDALSWEG
jgi:hypothetical protein